MSAPDMNAVMESADRLVRDILESLCRRDGLSLESTAVPGEAARNYELADRLGIGHVFGLRVTGDQAAFFEEMIADAARQGWEVTRGSAVSCTFRKDTVTVVADVRNVRDLVTLANGLRAMGLTIPGSILAGLAQTVPETPVRPGASSMAEAQQ